MLHVVDEGDGAAVVLLHAYPCDHTMWDVQAGALLSHGFRVIRPDLPGFGASPVPTAEPELRVMADAVLEALAGVETFALGGLSMGGYVAMQMLRQDPSRVSALMLIDTKATPDTQQAAQNRYQTALRAESEGSLAGLADGMLGGLLGPTTLAGRPQVVSRTARYIEAAPGAGAAWAMRAMAARPDSLPTLTDFDRPAMVIMGEEDALSPRSEHELMVSALPQGRLVTIAGCGHLSALEEPEAVAAAMIEFLGRSVSR